MHFYAACATKSLNVHKRQCRQQLSQGLPGTFRHTLAYSCGDVGNTWTHIECREVTRTYAHGVSLLCLNSSRSLLSCTHGQVDERRNYIFLRGSLGLRTTECLARRHTWQKP